MIRKGAESIDRCLLLVVHVQRVSFIQITLH